MEKYCATIANKKYDEVIQLSEKYKFIELRLDLLNLNLHETINIIHNCDLVVASCISNDFDFVAEHLSFAIDAKASIIDFPYNFAVTYNKFNELYQKATANNLKILLSYHNYISMQKIDELVEIIEVMERYSPHFFKIAMKCESQKDVDNLFHLFDIKQILFGKLLLIPMSSNPKLKNARNDALKFGSPYMYYCIDKPLAEGQQSILSIQL